MGRRWNLGWKACALVAPCIVAVAVTGGTARAAAGDISKFAGGFSSGSTGDGGLANAALLNQPSGVAVAADGRVFIADRENNRIRVVGTDGIINTLVSGLVKPLDVAVDDAHGLLYFSEEASPLNRLSSLDITNPAATPVVVAGGSSAVYGGDGGPASAATFAGIAGIDVAPNGDVYIADRQGNRIRRIVFATGDIELFAGDGTAGGTDGDALGGGPGPRANFAGPKDVAVAPNGDVFVADELTSLVRRISGGLVTVYAGNYLSGYTGDGVAATATRLNSPDSVAIGPDGNLYIADENNNRVRMVDAATQVITTVAGDGQCCYDGDGGPATSARIGNPVRLAFDARGNMLIASAIEHDIRLVAASPLVADAGGPYTIIEGGPLALDASATNATAGATYAWDLDGDGAFDDATGVAPTLNSTQLAPLGLADGPAGPVLIAVEVHDGVSVSVGRTNVSVANAAPTATINAPGAAVVGETVTVEVGAVDPGPADAAGQFSYVIDWEGDGTADETITGPADPPASHVYTAAGTVNLTVVAIDKDGARSEPVVATIAVAPAPTTTTTTVPESTTTTAAPTSPAPPTTAAPTTVPPPPPTMPPPVVLPATGGDSSVLAATAAVVLASGLTVLALRPRHRRRRAS